MKTRKQGLARQGDGTVQFEKNWCLFKTASTHVKNRFEGLKIIVEEPSKRKAASAGNVQWDSVQLWQV